MFYHDDAIIARAELMIEVEILAVREPEPGHGDANDRQPPWSSLQFVIDSASVDLDVGELSLRGAFSGYDSDILSVTMGHYDLDVVTVHEDQVIASLPSSLLPGTYRVTMALLGATSGASGIERGRCRGWAPRIAW